MKFRWREAKLCLLESGIFAINSSFGFGKSTDIWRSSFTNVFDILLLLLICIINIDSDLGVDIECPLARGQILGQFKNRFSFTATF